MRRPLLMIVLAAFVVSSSGCARLRPPAPAAIEVVWDGAQLITTSDAPLEGETVLTIINRSEDSVDARLLAIPAEMSLTEGVDLARSGGLSGLKLLGGEVLGPRRREPGRVAPRLVEEDLTIHIFLPAGTYLVAIGEDAIEQDRWLGFFVSPRSS